MAMKKKMSKQCEYCGAEFWTFMGTARFCKSSHQVNAFRKAQLKRLRELETNQ